MLSYKRIGNGPPLVLVHAFPFSQQMWEPNIPVLSKSFETISLDLPGFGDSPLSSDKTTMEEMVRQIILTLDTIGVKEKALFSGVSMGGYVLFSLVRQAPERVSGLILAATRAAEDTAAARAKRFQMIEKIQKSGVSVLADTMIPVLFGKRTLQKNPSLIKKAREWIHSASPEGVCSAMRGMAERGDSHPFLSWINVPTLVLAGEEDALIPCAEMEAMATQIPQSQFHVLEKTGHLLSVEDPDKFHSLVLDFFSRD